MKITKTLSMFAVSIAMTLSMTACNSKSKSPSGGGSSGPAMKAEGNANAATTSESELLQRYSLVELNSVANALKVIFDKSTDAKPETEPVLDCQISADEAKRLLNPLRSLIDTQTEHERESYTMDPGVYARSNGLETCGAKCACGVLANVLKPVAAKSFKTPSQRMIHERSVKRLQAKASRQTAEESLSCARKQGWFCSSDLRAFLDKQSGAIP